MILDEHAKEAVKKLRNLNLDSSNGLDDELFLFVSSLVPLPNVDLLVTNQSGQILLSYRDDEYYGQSWHIPGGCLRFSESFEHCIEETAKRELGCSVLFDKEPLSVKNVIRGPNDKQTHPNERGHNVAILFKCHFPDGFEINNGCKRPYDNGYLRWFDKLPDNFLNIQYIFKDCLGEWI